MGTWREKQVELLDKLNTVCKENSIDMFLYDYAALAAYRDGAYADEISLCIHAADVQRLIDAVESLNDDELKLEGMFNNGRYPYLNIRAYNPNTIDFNGFNFFKYDNNCIHVTIEIIRSVPSSKLSAKLLNLKYGTYRDNNRIHFHELSEKKLGKVRKFLLNRIRSNEGSHGAQRVSKDTFDALIKGYSGNSDKIMIGKANAKSTLFAKKGTVTVNGQAYSIPENTEQYLKKLFGKEWRLVQVPEQIESDIKFKETDFSWSEYKPRIANIDMEDYVASLKKSEEYKLKHRKYNEEIQDYYVVLDRTHARIKLWEKYEPIKNEILALASAKNYYELKELLGEYLQALEAFEEQNLGLCFDMDIFNVVKELLIDQGQEEYAKRLEALIPVEHSQTLKLKDYKGNYID